MKRKYSFGIFIILLIVMYGASSYAFSDEYEPYYPQITAVTRSVDDIYARISGSQVELTDEQIRVRKEMIQMYKDVGIDVSLDMENWLASYRMISDFPQRWSEETPIPLGESPDYSGAFSVDACWNNKIPENAPRVEIPRSVMTINDKVHIGVVKANIDMGGWGTGIPQIVSTSADPYYTIASKYKYGNINKVFMLRARENLFDYVNNAQTGDEHIQFVDAESNTSVQVWKGRVPADPRGYGLEWGRLPAFDVRANASGIEYRLDGIAAEGQVGVNAANCATNAFTIKSSEISSTTYIFDHALGGAIFEMVSARVFPAVSTDAALGMNSENEGSNSYLNTGVIPYGGIVQVDPDIDLDAIYNSGKLSFHSYRILRAMQEYGFYNIDCSGGSFFFYTNTYAGDWVNPDFRGFDVPYKDNKQGFSYVIDELNAFFKGDEFFGLNGEPKVYLTTPVVKYADLDVNDDGVIDMTDHDFVLENIGQAYTDTNKQYDVNQDKEISAADVEIMYNYLNNMPMHTFTWYDATYTDNDETHGRIIGSGTSTVIDGVTKYRDGMTVSFGAVPINGYEFAGWTGDFAEYDTPVVKITMDRDYSFGAKYRKLPEKKFTVKVLGPGHVEASETGVVYDVPSQIYGENTLLNLNAVPDEGYEFLGWSGDITGYANPASYIVNKDTEIIALFGESGYKESFKPDDWELASGSATAYKITEGSKISFTDFSQGKQVVVNTNKDKKIDLSGDFTFRAKMSNTTSIGDGNMAKLVFNYKDMSNHYYITLGGEGGLKLGKIYKGVESVLKEYKGSLSVKDVGFNKLPITIEISRSGSYLNVKGYKDGEVIEYFKVRDKSHSGGTIGFGTVYNGIFSASELVVQNTNLNPSNAVVQTWTKSGNNDPWLTRLKGAVAVAAGTNKVYANDDYATIPGEGIQPYFGADGTTVYVPVRYITETLGGKVSYDPATDSVVVTYGEHSGLFKAWTDGAQEVNGTLYVPGDKLAETLGKEYYQYEGKAPVFFSDTENVYNPDSEPECIEFIKKAFDIQYYM